MAFVKLTLSSNKLYVLINTERIIEFYADTDKDGLPCTKIVTDDGDYTSVTESLSCVLTQINKVKAKEIPEEESRPLPDEAAAKAAAGILKRFCGGSSCENCIFHEAGYKCKIKGDYPIYWDIPKGE